MCAVDKSSARGLRDYALLLMMSTYGLGAGEAIRLKFEDIDWTAGTIKLVRPKTGVAFTLPCCRRWPKRWGFTSATAGHRTHRPGTSSSR